MSQSINLTLNDIFRQAKYAFQMPALVRQAIEHQIILHAAEQAGLVIATAELQQAADALRVTHQLLSARATLDWLEKHYLSIDDFEDLAYTQLLRQKVADHHCTAQIAAHFADHQLDYAQAVIYQVTIAEAPLAMELFYSLQAQEQDFLAIVHRYLPEGSAQLRGDYRRVVRRQELEPEISAIVFAAQPPTVLRPIATREGHHLIYVAAIRPARLDPDLEAQIRQELFQTWLRQQVREWDVVSTLTVAADPTNAAS
jgi:parvulin-like peptidyl-prolyl isomerase